ncbi:MAG: enoyl-CoA hydratase/isomerase family protein [Synergistaceae bacterium]|nr:enoyl-CoA hydratase/isomerase family protein [Synergistaceae bacterium]
MSAVLSKVEGAIGTITLNRPEAMNTFNEELAAGLNESLRAMESDENVRVVIVEGAGKNFSTGIDLKEYLSKERHEIREFLSKMNVHNHTLASMTKPVIAKVRGYALANGTGLSLACDYVVASDDAVFGTTAINVGLICLEPGYQLARWIGEKRALQYVLTGDLIPAARGMELGFVWNAVPGEKLEEAVRGLADRLASKSRLAVKTGKRGFEAMSGLPLQRAVEIGGEFFAALAGSEDGREGVEAFIGKRPPVYKGK